MECLGCGGVLEPMRVLCLFLAAAACKPAVPSRPGPVEERRLAGQRCYLQRVGGAQPGERVPLVLSLHPMGADPRGALELFTSLRVPAVVVAPCGGLEDAAGNCEWFALRDPNGPAEAAGRVAAVATALHENTRGLPVVMGFSQGAVVALAAAREHPADFGAVFAVAGALSEPAVSRTRSVGGLPPIHAFLGDADPVFPSKTVQASLDRLRAEGYTADLRTYPGLDHDISDAEAADVRAAVEAAIR